MKPRFPISIHRPVGLLMALLFLLPTLAQAQTVNDCPAVSDIGSSRLICTSGTAANPDRDTGAVAALHRFVPFPFDPPAFLSLGDSNLSDSMRSASATYLYHVDTNNGWIFEVECGGKITFPIGATGPKPEFSIRILDSTGASINPVCLEAVYSGDNTSLWTQRTDNMVHLSFDFKFVCFDLRPLHGQTVQIRFNTTCRSAVQSNCLAQFSFGCTQIDTLYHNAGCNVTRYYIAPRGYRYKWTYAADTTNVISTEQVLIDQSYAYQYFHRLRCQLSFDNPTIANTRTIANLYVTPHIHYGQRSSAQYYLPYHTSHHLFKDSVSWDTLGYLTSESCIAQMRILDSTRIVIHDSNGYHTIWNDPSFRGEYHLSGLCDTLDMPDTVSRFNLTPGEYWMTRNVQTPDGCRFTFRNLFIIKEFPCAHYDTLIQTCPDDIDPCSARYKIDSNAFWYYYYNYYYYYPHYYKRIDTPYLDTNTGNHLSTVPPGFSSAFMLGKDASSGNFNRINLSFQFHVDTSQSSTLIFRYAVVFQHGRYQPRFLFHILDSSGQEVCPDIYSIDFTASSSLGWNRGSRSDIIWKDWTPIVINLQPLHGQTLTFSTTSATSIDGSAPQNINYAYIHFQCLNEKVSAIRCKDTILYTAPDGFQYEWYADGHPDSLLSTSQNLTAILPADSLFYCRLTDPNDTAIHFSLLAIPPPPQYPLARLSLDTLDILDDCSYLLRFNNRSVIATEHTPDSITTTPCNDIRCWLDDTILVFPDTINFSQKTSFRATPGQHTLTLVARTTGTSCTDTLIFPLILGDPCICRDTVFDTIVQNQLPHTWHGITFSLDSFHSQLVRQAHHESILNSQLYYDTSLFIPGVRPLCDSLIDYHLTLFPNTFDTVLFFLCPNAIPFRLNDSLSVSADTVVLYSGAHGEDSLVTFIVHLLHDSDTSITDTILESQLPWFFFDTLFTDTVTNYPFHLFNEQGCDSVIHYSLYIFWDGDHCDTTLTFPTLVTPNGDGINDRFVIGGLIENNCFRYNELLIYDRTGRLVYHARNISRESDWWDPAAHRVPDATYFYVFKAHGVKIHTLRQGVIEVLR